MPPTNVVCRISRARNNQVFIDIDAALKEFTALSAGIFPSWLSPVWNAVRVPTVSRTHGVPANRPLISDDPENKSLDSENTGSVKVIYTALAPFRLVTHIRPPWSFNQFLSRYEGQVRAQLRLLSIVLAS